MGLGGYLRQIRKEKALTMKEVADQLGVDYSLVSAYEVGKRQPSLRVLKRIAEVYGLSYLELLKMRDSKTKSEFESEYPKMLLVVAETHNKKFKEVLHTIRMLATRGDSLEDIKILATEVLIATDPENQAHCFPCHIDVMYRYFGQTATYNKNNVSKKYLQQYEKEDCPIVTCSKCAREVYYKKQADEAWEEYIL